MVVSPKYFNVRRSYNTRMHPRGTYGRPDPRRAMRQWQAARKILQEKLHMKLHEIKPLPGLDDMTFACDQGRWIKSTRKEIFIPANFQGEAHRWRQPEVAYFIQWMRARGVEIRTLSKKATFENGDCIPMGDKLIVGHGSQRTNFRAVEEMQDVIADHGMQVIPVERITEEFYHANSVMTYFASARLLLYYAPAFAPRALGLLKEALGGGIECLELPKELLWRRHPAFGGKYLYGYTLNAPENNGHALMPWCHPRLLAMLTEHNIVPEVTSSSERERSGGSHLCSLNIRHIVTPL